jgi:hypothetical protein
MKLSRSQRIAWGAAALIAGTGWGAVGFLVEGGAGLVAAALIATGFVIGIASLAND